MTRNADGNVQTLIPKTVRIAGGHPYTPGVLVNGGRYVFTSGLLARDPSGNLVGSDIRTQTTQVFSNIRGVLEEAGGGLQSIIKMTVYLIDRRDYDGMNEVRRQLLEGVPFVSTTIYCRLAEPRALVEIDAIATV